MKRFAVWCIFFLALVAGNGTAQTYTYYVDEVTTRAKQILISPGFMTIIEFYDDVDQVLSGRPNVVKLAGVTGSRIYLTAVGSSGSTDMVVDAASRSHLFKLDVVKGSAPRRYVIAPRPSAGKPVVQSVPAVKPNAATPASKPSANTTPQQILTGSGTSRPTGLTPPPPPRPVSPAGSQAVPPRPPAPAPAASSPSAQPSVAPVSSAPPPGVSGTPGTVTALGSGSPTLAVPTTLSIPENANVNPSWVDLALSHIQVEGGATTLYLVVRNTGIRSLMIDERALRVYDADRRPLPVVAPSTEVKVIAPGVLYSTRVTVAAMLTKEVQFEWLLFDLNNEATYLIKRGLYVDANTSLHYPGLQPDRSLAACRDRNLEWGGHATNRRVELHRN